MKLKFTSAAIGILALAASAHAQTNPANSTGDIIVGFKTSQSGNNLEVDAGAVSTLATFTTQTLISNYNTTLTSMSASWATLTNAAATQWAAVGTLNDTSQSYASYVWTNTVAGTLGTQNSAGWNPATVGPNLGSVNTHLNGLTSGFNLAISGGAGTSVDSKGQTIATSNSSSWNTNATTNNSAQFGAYGSPLYGVAGKLDTGTNFSAVDLFLVNASSITEIGTFALYNSTGNGWNKGDLTFTAAPSAVPEPSTYAAILGVATLGLIMARRRNREVVA